MKGIWLTVVALAGIALAAQARADMVYLTDGQSLWGREAYEEGDAVVIVRPDGELRVPKSRVSRIERTRSSLPPFYSPPTEAPAEGPAPPPGPGKAPAPGQAAPPGEGKTEQPPPPPSGGATTQLPPPPAPPPLSR